MKKNRLFNKTISLSLIFALYFSMSASAFADLDQETGVVEPTSETTVVENSAEEVSSDAQNNIETTPSEDNLQNVADENVASTESGTTETNSVVEEVKQIAEDVISKVTDKEVTSEGEAIDSTENKDLTDKAEAIDSTENKDLIDKAEAEDKLDEEKTEKDKSDEELEKEKLEKEKLEKEKLEKEECEHKFKYESNKDGTHKVTCSECEDFEEYTESCEYDEEGVCTKCGYHRLPDPVLVYEDDEVIVTVSGAVPENADLKVTPIKADVEETAEEYEQVKKSLDEKSENEEYVIKGFLAYDICFIDIETGEEVEPDGDVTVSLEYKQEAIPAEAVNQNDDSKSDILVNHFNEATSEIDELKEAGKAALTVTENNSLKAAEFTSDSFSKYVITWVETETRSISVEIVNQLEDGTELTPGNNTRALNPPSSTTEEIHEIAEFINENNIDGYSLNRVTYNGKEISKISCRKYSNSSAEYVVKIYYKNGTSETITTSNRQTKVNVRIDAIYEADTRLIITNVPTGSANADETTVYEYQVLKSDGTPLTNYSYEVVGDNGTYQTNAEGKFTIAPKQTVRFHDLDDGKYTVIETAISGKYSFADFVVKIYEADQEKAVYKIDSNEPRKIEVELSEANIPNIKFKNCYATTVKSPLHEEEVSKYISFKPDENNNDIYDLSIKFSGPEEKIESTINEQESYDIHTKKNVDIVLAIDKSNSMDGSNLTYVKNAIKAMVNVFESKKDEVDAKWKIVDFGTNAKLVSGKWINTEDVNDAFTTSLLGGTNYQAGLEKAYEELYDGSRDGAEKIIIFLTDGAPTQHYNSAGNVAGLGDGLSEETYTATMNAAAGVTCDQFYAVGMGLDTIPVYDYVEREERYWTIWGWRTRTVHEWAVVRSIKGYNLLEELANKVNANKRDVTNVSANQVGALFESLAGTITTETTGGIIKDESFVYASDVTMVDKLSEYVEIVPNSEFRISVSYGNSETPVLLPGNPNEPRTPGKIDENGVMSVPAYYYLEGDVTLTATYDSATKTITLNFPDDYVLDKRYSYSVKMTIQPTEKAYSDYINSNETYPEGMIGDDKTDNMFAVNKTSEGQPGFYSNDLQEAKVLYKFEGNPCERAFPKPVVQVHLLRQWEIYKTDANGKDGQRLDGAQFLLNDGNGNAYIGTSSTSDNNEGKVIWNLNDGSYIPVEKTYTLTEESAPTGYAKCDAYWEIALDKDNKPTVTTVAKQGVETECEPEIVRVKNVVTYKYYYKNIKQIGNIPNTGGSGTERTKALGFTLIMISTYLYVRNKKRNIIKRG